jgi:glycerol-3-phosphate dehydrogenase
VIGIESPGLTSSPAIGRYVAGLVCQRLHPDEKEDFIKNRKGILNPNNLPFEQRRELINRDPAYATHLPLRGHIEG